MPLQQCKLPNGKSGFKYGSNGKCYRSKKDAIKQGIAIDGPKKVREELTKASQIEDPEVQAALHESEPKGPAKFLAAAAAYCARKSEVEQATAAQTDFAVAYVSVEERKKMSLEDFGDPKRRRYPVKDQKHLDLAWDLSGREAPAAQKHIRQRLRDIAKRKGLKLPSTATNKKD